MPKINNTHPHVKELFYKFISPDLFFRSSHLYPRRPVF